MADGTIAIDEPSTVDKLLDTTQLTVGANTVQRERVQIAGAAATDLCPVDATKGLRVDLTNTGQNATALKVDGSAVTQPVSDGGGSLTVDGTVGVSGTVTVDSELTTADLDTGAGTDTRAVVGVVVAASGGAANLSGNSGNKDNGTVRVVLATDQPQLTNALKTDGSAVTQPISAGSLPLPTGAATEATLATVAGAVRAEDAASADGHTGIPALAIRKATPANTSGTDGDYEMLQMSAGRLWVDPSGVTLTVASHAVTNAGTFAVQDSQAVAEDAAHASGDKGFMALGVRQTAPTDLSAGNTNGDYEPFQVGKNGGLWISGSAEAGGGCDFKTGSIGATKTDIGTANIPTALYGWYFYNSNASAVYVQMFNAQASAVTLGTTAPDLSFGIPAGSAANVPPGAVSLKFGTALSIAITTTRAGSTGPGSTVDYNVFYKQ